METVYPHNEALADHNYQMKDVPENIRKKIYGWNARYKSFEQNPTKKQQENLMKDSLTLADAIQTFAEEKALKPSQPANVPNAEPNQPDVPQIAGLVNQQSNSDLQQAIQGYLSKEGRIYHIDLKKLMGQGSIPDRVEVGELVLTRSFAFYYPA